MGVVAPISAAAAIIPVAFGLARGERPSGLQLAGIAAALVGVALASREPGETARLAAGVGLALVAAVGFGSYIVLIDEAAEASAAWAVLVSRGTASLAAVSVALAVGRLTLSARALPALAVIGLFDVSANGLLALALNEGLVSLVSVLSSLYPVVTIALARALLGELIGRVQAGGAAIALAGVGLISAG
jgi:drug/metabolite transporter (DMT)-like permease